MSASSTSGSNSSSASTPSRTSLVVPMAAAFPEWVWTADVPGQRPGLAGRGYLVPQAAVQVEPVAVGLTRGAVADVGVQRMPVVSGLDRPAGAGEHGKRSGD